MLIDTIRTVIQHPFLGKVSKNVGWLILDKSLKGILAITVTTYVGRHLGPENYGIINYANACVYLFAIFTSMGLDSIVIREIVKKEIDKHILLGST